MTLVPWRREGVGAVLKYFPEEHTFRQVPAIDGKPITADNDDRNKNLGTSLCSPFAPVASE